MDCGPLADCLGDVVRVGGGVAVLGAVDHGQGLAGGSL